MPRPPKPWYWRGGWYTEFDGGRRLLLEGPKNPDTQLQAEQELLKLRQESRLLNERRGAETHFGVVAERFLNEYIGRPAYDDFSNQLHWFMGIDYSSTVQPQPPKTKRGKNRPPGGRFGVPCKDLPLRRINAALVEKYLRRRKAAGLSGYHAFIAIRTLLNWAKRKGYIASHDLDRVDRSLHRKGRRRYLPPDADVVKAFQAAKGKFKELLFIYTLTGIRPSELRTMTIDEFDRPNKQWALWRHKIVERTGQPKIVPLGNDELVAICAANAGDRGGAEPLFLNDRNVAWTYNALRLRWRRLRAKASLDLRFSLYSLRHWYLTVAVESGEDGAIVSELAGHVDPSTLEFYKKIRNQRLHQAARRVASAISRVGIASLSNLKVFDESQLSETGT